MKLPTDSHPTYLVGGTRTPVGRFGGSLAFIRADDLAASVIKAQVERLDLDSDSISDVILGAANQAGDDNRNVARMAVLLAGLGDQVPGYTVNRLCASGLQAVASAAQAIKSREANLILAGGVESMTRAPWVIAKPEQAFAKPTELFDSALGWRLVNPKMQVLDGGEATLSLGLCTEKLARLMGITRDESDEFAQRSQQRAAMAREQGWFDGDIVAITVPNKKSSTNFMQDETVRADTNLESLASLKPVFLTDGIVTAGNASPLSDGASILVAASESALAENHLQPRARVIGCATAGVAPSLFGLGPVPAIQKLMARFEFDLSEIDVIEINEAYAAQVLACTKELGIDPEIVNKSGGAIALGHPLGSSGSRILITAMGELERTKGRYAIISLCIGVGQGAAMLIERA